MKLFLLMFIFLIGCSSIIDIRSGAQYNQDKARCEVIASDIMRTIKRDTFMEKLRYYLLHSRSIYTDQCMRDRGYKLDEGWEDEEEDWDDDE